MCHPPTFPGERHLPGGLHRREGQVRHLCAAHSREVPEEAVQEGAVPHCREVLLLHHQVSVEPARERWGGVWWLVQFKKFDLGAH